MRSSRDHPQHNGRHVTTSRVAYHSIKVTNPRGKIGMADAEVNEVNEVNRFFQKYFGFLENGHL
jgi:hypothetical protein